MQLLYASGFLFMGATEEQMVLLDSAGITHVSYVLILYSIAFVLFLCKCPTTIPRHKLTETVVNILLHIYAVHAWPEEESADGQEGCGKYANANGSYMNGRARSTSEAQRIHDAETFELQGLISEEEEEAGSSMGPKKANDEEMAKEHSRQ